MLNFSLQLRGWRLCEKRLGKGKDNVSILKSRLLIVSLKMVFLLNGRPVDALALIVHRSAEKLIGRAWVKKLREL